MDENSRSAHSWNVFAKLSTDEVRKLIEMLQSPMEHQRRRAIQSLVELEDSPIQRIDCWPEMKCTQLQLFAAEVIILEWLKHLRRNPAATEAEIIGELFPEEEDLGSERAPRFRTLARAYSEPPTVPIKPSRFAAALDRLSETVKNSILDFSIGPEPNEFTAPNSQDIPLQPLDRKAFEERMQPRMANALEVAGEFLSKPATDRELAECAEQLGKVADSLRWNALEIAMELRTAEARPESDTKNSPTEMPPKSWAKKFRLMRASGF